MYNWIHTVAVLVQVISAIGVIVLVLLQHGKGADMGAAFGSGASGSLFGATGSANFLSRATGVLAAVFLCSTLGLSYLSNDAPRSADSLMQGGANPASPVNQVPVTVPPAPGPADVPSVPTAPSSGASGNPSVPAAPGSAGVPSVPAAAVPSVPAAAGGDKAGSAADSVPSTSGNASNPK